MRLKTSCQCFAYLAAAGFVGGTIGCEAGGDADLGVDFDNPSQVGDGTTALAIRFATSGPLDTRCGTADGIHVQISDGLGEVQSCNADWAPADSNGQLVSDCFFVVHPGVWSVDDVSVTDTLDQPLSCCVGSYPSDVSVSESSTTEFGADFTCDTVSNGAVDIFARVNRPPTIEDIDILPSKFGNTCSLINLVAQASDPDGDGVSYAWGVMDSPKDSGYAVATRGNNGYFVGNGIGTYELRLVVTDDYQATHYLDLPIHLTGGGTCAAQETLDVLMP
jgi:hypothetical protein